MKKYLDFLWLLLFLQSFHYTNCETQTRCLKPTTYVEIFLSCNTDQLIWVKEAFRAKTLQNSTNFCDSPVYNDTDCRQPDDYLNTMGLDVSQRCNAFSTCRAYVDPADWTCQGDYGASYAQINYNCMPRIISSGKDIPFLYTENPRNFTRLLEKAFLFSSNYAQWSRKSPNQCSVKVTAGVKVTIQVLDLRGRYINAAGDCPYKLYLNEGKIDTYYEVCANMAWDGATREFPAHTTEDKAVDIVFNQGSGAAEGILWLIIDVRDNITGEPAYFDVYCGPDIKLQDTPETTTTTLAMTTATPTKPSSTTPTTTTPETTTTILAIPTAAPTHTSSTTPTTTTSTTTASTTTTTTPSTTTPSKSSASQSTTTFSTTTENVNGSSAAANDKAILAPVIAGSAVGGVFLIIIMLMVILVCGRKKPRERHPRQDVNAVWGTSTIHKMAKNNQRKQDPHSDALSTVSNPNPYSFGNGQAGTSGNRNSDGSLYEEIDENKTQASTLPPQLNPIAARPRPPVRNYGTEVRDKAKTPRSPPKAHRHRKEKKDKKGSKPKRTLENYGFDPPDELAHRMYGTADFNPMRYGYTGKLPY